MLADALLLCVLITSIKNSEYYFHVFGLLVNIVWFWANFAQHVLSSKGTFWKCGRQDWCMIVFSPYAKDHPMQHNFFAGKILCWMCHYMQLNQTCVSQTLSIIQSSDELFCLFQDACRHFQLNLDHGTLYRGPRLSGARAAAELTWLWW